MRVGQGREGQAAMNPVESLRNPAETVLDKDYISEVKLDKIRHWSILTGAIAANYYTFKTKKCM